MIFDHVVCFRYIERFRNNAPMSREERGRKAETGSRDFWWLSDTQEQKGFYYRPQSLKSK